MGDRVILPDGKHGKIVKTTLPDKDGLQIVEVEVD
jgi:hypothetical protein